MNICTTYDAHDPILLNGVMPFVDMIEVTPDTISTLISGTPKIREDVMQDLKEASATKKILAHGVGLSIGSFDQMNLEYFKLIDQLKSELDIYWHSEHLGFTHVNGENLNTMLPLPKTDESLDLLIPRIRSIMDKYQMPFLVENIAHMVPLPSRSYSDANFLNRLAGETGCQFILDIYNMECDAINFGFDISGFLDEFNLENAREIHIAGGVNEQGFQMDVHSRGVAESTIQWTLHALEKPNNIEVITYEILPEAVSSFGQNMVIEEVHRIKEIFVS